MGEKGHGMDTSMMSNAMPYHIATVLNLSVSFALRFAAIEPMVTIMTAISIMRLCSMPKYRMLRSWTASL